MFKIRLNHYRHTYTCKYVIYTFNLFTRPFVATKLDLTDSFITFDISHIHE